MNYTPVNTYGLCEGLLRGDTFKIREETNIGIYLFDKGDDVTIADFTKKKRPPRCKNKKARFLIFKGHEPSYWHPAWIIDCNKCPFDVHSTIDQCEDCSEETR